MFENIIGQERVVESLRSEIREKRLPQSILLSGPDYSGKLSIALELARVFTCHDPLAPWNCTCPSCVQNRFLTNPYLMCTGGRYFGREIRGSGRALLSDDKDGTRFLFLRALRKLTRRFDAVMWEGETKVAAASKLIDKIEESAEPLMPGRPSLGYAEIEAAVEDIYPNADSLAALLPFEGISVSMIRRLAYWAHTADSRQTKTIIIENAQAMNEASRNSLLKVLEEPPPGVWFILCTRQRQAIMPTVLSRVRTYSLVDRGPLESQVLQRIFRQNEGSSLREFFASVSKPKNEGTAVGEAEAHGALVELLVRKAGLGFLYPAGSRHSSGSREGFSSIEVPKDREKFEDIIRSATRELLDLIASLDGEAARAALRAAGKSEIEAADVLQSLARRLQKAYNSVLTYNIATASALERVYFDSTKYALGT